MKRIDLTGKSFGRLTVARYAHSVRTKSGGGYAMWKCACLCGKSTIVRTSHLTEGRIKSCGCLFTEGAFVNNRGAKPPGVAYLRYVFLYYEKNAKTRNLQFKITFEEFCEITSKDCHYCGNPPEMGKNKSRLNRPNVFNGVVNHNGIDRVNNLVGYVQHNIVPCCKRCNRSKRDMPETEFIAWAHQLHRHLAATGR